MHTFDRRAFLRLAGVAGMGGLGLPSLIAAEPRAVATDYKAVICLYLNGGLDHPYDTASFNALKVLRPEQLSRARSEFLPLGTGAQEGRELAFHPTMPGFKALYDAKRLAYISQIGELSRPTTRAEIIAGTYTPGRAAGSHNDGNSYANGLGYEGTQYGWGGLMLDAVFGLNPKSAFSSINLADSIFGSARLVRRVQVDLNAKAENLVGLGQRPKFFDNASEEVLRAFAVTNPRTNLLEDAFNGLAKNIDATTKDAADAFAASDAAVDQFTYPADTIFYRGRDNNLAREFRTVARLMQQREFLGVRRQVFNMSLGGFDTHGNAEDQLNRLMGTIDASLVYFFQQLDKLGLANSVTVIINSEFGRSLPANSSGTDHGWGGGWFALGGAVKGGNVYGRIPVMDKNGPDNQAPGIGSTIPVVCPEQFGATIARWFGVAETDIGTIFPRLANFSTKDLGFMDNAVVAGKSVRYAGESAAGAAASDDPASHCGIGGMSAVALAGAALLALRNRNPERG